MGTEPEAALFEVICTGTMDKPPVIQIAIRSRGQSSVYEYPLGSIFIVNKYCKKLDAIRNSKTLGKGKRYQKVLKDLENESGKKYDRRLDLQLNVNAQKIPAASREIAGKMTAEFYENDEDQNMSKWVIKDSEGVLIETLLDELFPEGEYIYDDVSGQEYGEKLIQMIRNLGLEDAEDEIYALNAGMKKCAYTDYSDIDIEEMPKPMLIKLLLAIMNEIPINEVEREELDGMSRRIKDILDSREN